MLLMDHFLAYPIFIIRPPAPSRPALHHHTVTLLVSEVFPALDVLGNLILNRLLEKLPGPFTDDLFKNGSRCFLCLLSVVIRVIILHGRILPSLLATGDILRFNGSQ